MANAVHSTPSGVNEPGLPKRRRAARPLDPVQLRRRMERAVERLISAMDHLDVDTEDLEEGGDLEPALGSVGSCLGQPHFSQMNWAESGDVDEREKEDEHGGNILDEPHDEEPDLERNGDEEPNLGAPENPHAQVNWARGLDEPTMTLSSDDREANRHAADAAAADLRRISDRLRPTPSNVMPFCR